MSLLGEKLLVCVQCSYREVSEVEILEEVTESYILRCLKLKIDDPRIQKYYGVIFQTQPDGTQKAISKKRIVDVLTQYL